MVSSGCVSCGSNGRANRGRRAPVDPRYCLELGCRATGSERERPSLRTPSVGATWDRDVDVRAVSTASRARWSRPRRTAANQCSLSATDATSPRSCLRTTLQNPPTPPTAHYREHPAPREPTPRRSRPPRRDARLRASPAALPRPPAPGLVAAPRPAAPWPCHASARPGRQRRTPATTARSELSTSSRRCRPASAAAGATLRFGGRGRTVRCRDASTPSQSAWFARSGATAMGRSARSSADSSSAVVPLDQGRFNGMRTRSPGSASTRSTASGGLGAAPAAVTRVRGRRRACAAPCGRALR